MAGNGPRSYVWLLIQFRGILYVYACVCGRLSADPKVKEKAVRLTKISLNAFNGAERAVSLQYMPVRAPFGFVVGVSLRVQWATNGLGTECIRVEPTERTQSSHRAHTLSPHTLCRHTHCRHTHTHSPGGSHVHQSET